MRDRVEKLVKLAEEIISGVDNLSPQDQLDILDRYADCFGEIVEGDNFQQEIEELEPQLQKELSKSHQRVLELAMGLKDETSKELKSLKRKGQGILAYLDQYPQPTTRKPRRKG